MMEMVMVNITERDGHPTMMRFLPLPWVLMNIIYGRRMW
jgi:hypothetical protein